MPPRAAALLHSWEQRANSQPQKVVEEERRPSFWLHQRREAEKGEAVHRRRVLAMLQNMLDVFGMVNVRLLCHQMSDVFHDPLEDGDIGLTAKPEFQVLRFDLVR